MAVAITLDATLTLAFVLVGRASHAESFGILGILETWWPFLIGLIIGWLMLFAWRTPHGIILQGVTIWGSTVVVGLLLRFVTGQGAELSFIVVTVVAIGVLLIGWRLIARYFARRPADT